MSLPRRLVPGRTHSLVRRTSRRCFFLRPERTVNEILQFALGVAMSRHSVELHAGTFESTHHHLNVTDAGDASSVPDFMRDLHSLSARALNAHYGRSESIWCDGSYDNVEVHGLPTLEEQLLYTWTQCVKDGLVEHPEDWPGTGFLPEDFGREITVHRPETAFFGGRRPDDWEPTYAPARQAHRRARRLAEQEERRAAERAARGAAGGDPGRRSAPSPRSSSRSSARAARPGARPPKERAPRPERRDRRTLPASVTFTISPPPGYDHMTLDEVRAHFRRLLDERLARIWAERAALGLGYLGVAAVLAQDPLESAGEGPPTFGRNPRLACLDKALRPILLAQLTAWRLSHRVALLTWRSGQREVEFPHGSYGHARLHGARVASATGPPV